MLHPLLAQVRHNKDCSSRGNGNPEGRGKGTDVLLEAGLYAFLGERANRHLIREEEYANAYRNH